MFQGFTPEAVEFLWGIKFNNNREWFLPRKEQFLALLDRPMRELGSELFDAIAAEYPKQSLKLHVCRIYRDARRLFGRGPYKDHLWFTIERPHERFEGVPALYFEIAPNYFSYGCGDLGRLPRHDGETPPPHRDEPQAARKDRAQAE